MKKDTLTLIFTCLAIVLIVGVSSVFVTNFNDDGDNILGIGGGQISGGSSTPEDEAPDETGCAHSFAEKVTLKATCQAEGVKQLTCKNCGISKQEIIPMKDHVWGSVTTSVESTCEIVSVLVCSDCRFIDVRGTGSYAHSFEYGTCLNCGDSDPDYTGGGTSSEGSSEPEEDPDPVDPCVNGHSYVTISSVDPTCTSAGYTTSRCDGCGSVITETVPSPGHSYKTVQTDVGDDGKKHFVKECTECGDRYIT